ncbi:hypothetical protein JSE7799_00323 [Jannaschia seosinensis]|uniref:Uncharacterized protein n=1 Tax=Jannaschia seosinensis TaxID=313367 RepID=A0A0M7B6E4_9RHOB|nr:hypothetical protein [Jannaschia seosinensis]CUH15794.1 hypothetical protein JSE7799_00323 [Jannaschia seosinensis]
MRGHVRSILLAASLAGVSLAAAPVHAEEPPAQLAATVQHRLNLLGFGHVHARELSVRQLAALHLELQGRALALGGLHRMKTRQRVEVILGWD